MRDKLIFFMIILSILLIGCRSKEEIRLPAVDVPPEVPVQQVPAEGEVAETPKEKCFTPEEFEEEFCEENRCTIAVVVTAGTKKSLEAELMQYKTDVEKELNYDMVIKEYPDSVRKEDIKRDLIDLHDNANLRGVLFVGNIPTGEFKGAGGVYGETYPTDHYYVDIFGECERKSLENVNCNNPLILMPYWTARLTPPKDDINLLRAYFKKNHEYRTGKFKYDKEILVFPPIWFEYSAEQQNRNKDALLTALTGNNLAVSPFKIYDQSAIRMVFDKDSFLNEISKPYEYVFINAHGTPTWHQAGKEYSLDTNRIVSDEVVNSNPLIYVIGSCSVGRFTEPNYLAGNYLFNGRTLFVEAATVPVFVTGLNWQEPFLLTGGLRIFEVKNILGLATPSTMLGDPTIKMRYDRPSTSRDAPKICLSHKELDLGRVPTVINYDDLQEFAAKEKEMRVTITNNGKSDLIFSSWGPKINSRNDYQRVDFTGSYYEPPVVKPGETKELKLQYITEYSGEFSGEWYIMSNDPEHPLVKIPFKGIGVS